MIPWVFGPEEFLSIFVFFHRATALMGLLVGVSGGIVWIHLNMPKQGGYVLEEDLKQILFGFVAIAYGIGAGVFGFYLYGLTIIVLAALVVRMLVRAIRIVLKIKPSRRISK